jgi:hypothetical protein
MIDNLNHITHLNPTSKRLGACDASACGAGIGSGSRHRLCGRQHAIPIVQCPKCCVTTKSDARRGIHRLATRCFIRAGRKPRRAAVGSSGEHVGRCRGGAHHGAFALDEHADADAAHVQVVFVFGDLGGGDGAVGAGDADGFDFFFVSEGLAVFTV